MKHEHSINAHPSHPALTGRDPKRTDGHRDKPSPAFDPHDSNDADGFSRVLRSLPLSVVVTVLAGLALSAVGAAIALRAPDPVALIGPLSWGVVGLASLFGGILSGRRAPASPVGAALLCGAVTVVLLTVAGLCAGGGIGSPSAWLLRLTVLPLHLIGAYLTRPRERAPSHGDHTAGRHHNH